MLSLANSGHSHYLSYVDALFHEDCMEEALMTFLYRESGKNDSKQKISIHENISTATLVFDTGQKVQISKESSGVGVKGHAERRAFVLAINEAIKKRYEKFANLPEIQNTRNPTPRDFYVYQEALNSLAQIKVYTERIPCNKPDIDKDKTEPCNIFFADLLQGAKYDFYYSVRLSVKKEMEDDLEKQLKEARRIYQEHKKINEELTRMEEKILTFMQLISTLDPSTANTDELQQETKNRNRLIILIESKINNKNKEELENIELEIVDLIGDKLDTAQKNHLEICVKRKGILLTKIKELKQPYVKNYPLETQSQKRKGVDVDIGSKKTKTESISLEPGSVTKEIAKTKEKSESSGKKEVTTPKKEEEERIVQEKELQKLREKQAIASEEAKNAQISSTPQMSLQTEKQMTPSEKPDQKSEKVHRPKK